MRIALLALLLIAAATPALAQYKCTAANGAITFQGTPCFGYTKEQRLEVRPNGVPIAASRPASGASGVAPAPTARPVASAASGVGGSVDKRMLAKYEQQHQRERLQKAIDAVQDDVASHASQKAADIAAVQKTLGGDAAALQAALAAINSRYQAMSDLDTSRLAAARSDLAAWDKSQSAR